MGTLVKITFAAALTLAATPALALTLMPAGATPTARQFSDPDEALDSTSSALRDQVVQNNAPFAGGGGGGTFGVSNFVGGSGDASDAAMGYSSAPSGAARSTGAMPTLSGAELYDQEPPFMPIVVGAPSR